MCKISRTKARPKRKYIFKLNESSPSTEMNSTERLIDDGDRVMIELINDGVKVCRFACKVFVVIRVTFDIYD